LDLSGSSAGSILNSNVATIPGVEYEVTFALSGNGDLGGTSKRVLVTADSQTQEFEYLIDSDWSRHNLRWSKEGLRFVAHSNTTEVSFQSLENSSQGPLLADIEIRPVPNGVNNVLSSFPGTIYNNVTGKFYKIESTNFNWNDASSNAQATLLNNVPGRLLSINTQHENSFIKDTIAVGTSYWTGGNDVAENGKWRWSTGERFWQGHATGSPVNDAFTDWRSALEPNNSSPENSIEIRKDGWNNHDSADLLPYIVEWDAHAVLGQYSYKLLNDATNRFNIDQQTGEITVGNGLSSLNFEQDEFHNIDVEVTDEAGNNYNRLLQVEVNDINEPPEGIDESDFLPENSTHTFVTIYTRLPDRISGNWLSIIFRSR